MDMKDRIASLKEIYKLTTEDLSLRSGVPAGTINKILNGETPNPRLSTTKALARSLNCSIDYLTGESNYTSNTDETSCGMKFSDDNSIYQTNNFSNSEIELITLWRESSVEGQQAAKIVLQAHKIVLQAHKKNQFKELRNIVFLS